MNTIKKDTRWMVSVALMAAIVVLLANTPLGMIQLPIIKATTVHIPVIIGAILLGPAAGAILGATFGICSLISNTMAPTLLSFAFSPFLSTTGLVGAVKAIWISVGSIYVLLAKQYAQAREVGKSAVFGLIMGTVTATGIPEAIAAAILVVALGKVLLRVFGTIWNRTGGQAA